MNFFSKRSISIVTAGVLFSLVLFGALILTQHHQSQLDSLVERRERQTQKYREQWEQKGILSALDHARLIKISVYIQKRQEMSDDDLDFWIDLLRKGPIKDTPSNRSLFYTVVMEDAIGHKHLSQSGQRKMYDALLPFVSDEAYAKAMNPNDTQVDQSDPSSQINLRAGNERIALLLLTQTRDPRVLSTLKSLAKNSSNAKLRDTANTYYIKLEPTLQH